MLGQEVAAETHETWQRDGWTDGRMDGGTDGVPESVDAVDELGHVLPVVDVDGLRIKHLETTTTNHQSVQKLIS